MFLYPLAYVAVWPAAVCMLAVGLPGALTRAGYTTLFQRHTADAYRGRVFAAIGVTQAVALIAGTLTAGLLGESVGIVPIIAMQGVGYIVAGVAIVAAFRRRWEPAVEQPSAGD